MQGENHDTLQTYRHDRYPTSDEAIKNKKEKKLLVLPQLMVRTAYPILYIAIPWYIATAPKRKYL